MIYLHQNKYVPGVQAHVRPLVSSMEVLIKNISHVRVDKTQLGKQSAARPRDHPPLIMRGVACLSFYTLCLSARYF